MFLFCRSGVSARFRPEADSIRTLARSALALVLSILVFFPALPSMPSATIDASWRMALNEAWARGIDFSHVVFSYGPYAFVSTGQYAPETYAALLSCALFLGTVLFLLVRYLGLGSRGVLGFSAIPACLIVSAYTGAADVRFYCLAFLLLAAAARHPQANVADIGESLLLSAPVVLNLASFALGLICLVKATYAVEVSAMGILGVIALYATGRRLMAPAVLLSFLSGLAVFWLIAGQRPADLLPFFMDQEQVAAGYGQAMSVGGSLLPPVLFLLSAVPLAAAIKRDLQSPTVCKFAVASGLAVTLLLAFKEGFVRQDTSHAMEAAEAMLILPWCWRFGRGDFWRQTHTVMAVIAAMVFIAMYPHALGVGAKARDIERLVHCSDRGPIVCPIHSDWLEKTYDLSLARIRAQIPLPHVQGSVDAYTFRQSLVIANGYGWDPRPVIQSYSAYTPVLARMNADHLIGAKAPDAVLFALEPIDDRLPAFADGPSWPILLSQYGAKWIEKPREPFEGLVIACLRHEPDWRRISVVDTPVLEGAAELGHRVDLPKSDEVLFAKIDIRQNALGELAALLLKAPRLYINFLFPDGHVEHYRFVPGMAHAGFVISPVVTDTTQFVALHDLKVGQTLSARLPTAFWLSGTPGARLTWTNAAVIHVSEIRDVSN